jgi:hypothetical protein
MGTAETLARTTACTDDGDIDGPHHGKVGYRS